MSNRGEFRAMTGKALTALSGAALILNGLLLLSIP
jgi:hypothetical protein